MSLRIISCGQAPRRFGTPRPRMPMPGTGSGTAIRPIRGGGPRDRAGASNIHHQQVRPVYSRSSQQAQETLSTVGALTDREMGAFVLQLVPPSDPLGGRSEEHTSEL